MTVKKAIKIRTALLAAIIIVSLFGQHLSEYGATIAIGIDFILFAAVIYIQFKYIKCPDCGRIFGPRFPFGAEHCPYCGCRLK